MRIPHRFRVRAACLALAAGLVATGLSAQDSDPPAGSLSDLNETLESLSDERTQAGEAEPRPAPEPEAENVPEPPLEAEAPPTETEAVTPAPAPSATPAPRAPPLTRVERTQLDRTAERGRLLISIAQAGILATQDMLTRISDPEGAGIAGWIAQPQGNGFGVTFYADGDDGPSAVYRTSILGGRVVSRDIYLSGDRPALNPVQARMAAARTATDALDHQACTDMPFNVLVIPPAGPDAPIDVYQVTPPAERGRFPLGGYFRTTIAPDGSVAEDRALTSGCAFIEAAPPAEGERPAPIGVTHTLDPMPGEVHLFLAQLVGRPLLVATGEPQRIWLVTDERIAEVRP